MDLVKNKNLYRNDMYKKVTTDLHLLLYYNYILSQLTQWLLQALNKDTSVWALLRKLYELDDAAYTPILHIEALHLCYMWLMLLRV